MVSATGMCHVAGRRENVAYLTLFFDHNLIGHINVNWLSPVKVRQTLIGGSKKMIVYDDLEPSEKIKVYDRGITVSKTDEQRYQILVDYRTGDMWAPWIDRTEALKTEVRHFAACIEEGSRPLTDVRVGLRVVSMLEAASQSMRDNGRPIKLQLGELA
jgi:predicted dehydrogenase